VIWLVGVAAWLLVLGVALGLCAVAFPGDEGHRR
jgi:hypothetical protein